MDPCIFIILMINIIIQIHKFTLKTPRVVGLIDTDINLIYLKPRKMYKYINTTFMLCTKNYL